MIEILNPTHSVHQIAVAPKADGVLIVVSHAPEIDGDALRLFLPTPYLRELLCDVEHRFQVQMQLSPPPLDGFDVPDVPALPELLDVPAADLPDVPGSLFGNPETPKLPD